MSLLGTGTYMIGSQFCPYKYATLRRKNKYLVNSQSRYVWRINKYQFYSLWFNPTGAQTHNLTH